MLPNDCDPNDQKERRRLIKEARRAKNMGLNKPIEFEDRLNPVCEWNCQKCHRSIFKRRYLGMTSWPWHCQQPMTWRGEVKETKAA